MRPGWVKDDKWYWFYISGEKRAAIREEKEAYYSTFTVMGRPYAGYTQRPYTLSDAQPEAEAIVERGGAVRDNDR